MSQLNPVNKSFCLHQLFESNYFKLLRLIPQLHAIQSPQMQAELGNKPALHLTILDKTRFTLEIQLAYDCQTGATEPLNAESSLHIRIYLDSKTAEVITLSADLHLLPANDYPKAAVDAKWPDNYMLDKWLTHCLTQGYRLTEANHPQAIPA
ncbi:MAG TPA: DUF1249 domain-containing protein [Crenotrichaceae bacterium]|nr:DUF1249 domain-containing protein [Crenotrichaceae bacterium]